MQYNATILTFVFAFLAIALAIVALSLHNIMRKDGRGASMHTHQVLAERRRLLKQQKEEKTKIK